MRLAKYIPILATTLVCVLLYTIAAMLYPGFSSARVLINFFADNSFLGIIAIGMTLVILSGGIDLSVGAVMALCSIIMAVLMGQCHLHPILTIFIALTTGTTLGFITGCIIHYFKIEPFIATLAGMFFARGLAQIIHIQSMPIENKFYSWITAWGIPLGAVSLPISAIIFIAIVCIAFYITTYTPLGRNIYAIGGDEKAATLMGLPIGRTKILVYTLSGFCAALAGVVFTIYQSAGDPSAGIGMELDAIAVVVIGGTLLTGGAGYVFGTLVGVLIFGIIQTGIMFQGTLSSWWTKVAIGVLLLGFILLQKLLSQTAYARKKG